MKTRVNMCQICYPLEIKLLLLVVVVLVFVSSCSVQNTIPYKIVPAL